MENEAAGPSSNYEAGLASDSGLYLRLITGVYLIEAPGF
jgi:hypothetical protein